MTTATPNSTTKPMHNPGISQGQEKLSEAYKLAGEAACDMMGSVKHQAKDSYEKNKDRALDLTEQGESMIRERPLLSLGCAFVAGWAISKLLK